jgi:site-specific DNA recombinase
MRSLNQFEQLGTRQRRAIIYARVSTDAQERDGTSLDTQERACQDWADANNRRVVEVIRDVASGYTLDRPGILRARQILREGGTDDVVVFAVDRLSRNQNHIGVLFEEIQDAEAALCCVSEPFEDTPMGRFILNAYAFAAEVEHEKIRFRTMIGKRERAASGRLPQGTNKGAYGYVYDRATGKREIHPEQAPVVSRIFGEVVARVSLVAIANRLNTEGIPAFGGGIWYPATLHHLLRNPIYMGRTVYGRLELRKVRDPRSGERRAKRFVRDEAKWVEVEGATPAIVDEATFLAAQAVLDDPERRKRAQRVYEYALSGRLRCAKCGRAMVGQTLTDRRYDRTYTYYRCRASFGGVKADRCDSTYVRASKLEEGVRARVAEALADARIIYAEYQRQRQLVAEADGTAALTAELEALDNQRRRLAKLYQLGEVDDEYFEAEAVALRSKRQAVESRMGTRRAALPELSVADLDRACAAVRDWILNADGDRLARMAEALQMEIAAEKGWAEVEGVLPDSYAPTDDHAHVRAMVIDPTEFRLATLWALPQVVGQRSSYRRLG